MAETEATLSFTLTTPRASLLLALYHALVAGDDVKEDLTGAYTFNLLVPALETIRLRLGQVMDDWADEDFTVHGISKHDASYLRTFIAMVPG